MSISIEKIKQNLEPILKSNDIDFAAVFGSHASGRTNKDSDIDLLVRFTKPKSLFELVRLERNMSEILRNKVDLLTEDSLSPYFREDVMQNLVVIYGQR